MKFSIGLWLSSMKLISFHKALLRPEMFFYRGDNQFSNYLLHLAAQLRVKYLTE